MIRTTAAWLFVAFICGYSWRDWYKGTCGLVLFMAVMQHPDMPKSVLGIPGLNPFNLMLFNVILAWLVNRRREGLVWDVPRHITVLLALYAVVVIVGFVRMLEDTELIRLYYRMSMANVYSEFLINTIKWTIPGLILFDGCRTRERFHLALGSVLAVYVILSLQVAKWMPPHFALDADLLERRSLKVLVSGMGFHRVNLSAMLAGASWAILACRPIVPTGARWLLIGTTLLVVYAQAMTAGRTGYVTWALVGFALSMLRWRRYLLLVPVVIVLVMWAAPGVVGRMTQGFTPESHDSNVRLEEEGLIGDSENFDAYTVTSGRSIAWPFIIEAIAEHPWVGWGRQAMLHSGVAVMIYEKYGEIFPHPHNAYLELLFDNGLVGFAIIMPFYGLILLRSIRLFRHPSSATCVAIGGVSTALVLSLLIAAAGSQTFYPREGWVGMWCALWLMLRVHLQYKRAEAKSAQPEAAAHENGKGWPNTRTARPVVQPWVVPAFSRRQRVAGTSATAAAWRPSAPARRPAGTPPPKPGLSAGARPAHGTRPSAPADARPQWSGASRWRPPVAEKPHSFDDVLWNPA